jgi:hypothetical protein
MAERLKERAKSAAAVWELLATLEHELDWGACSDTCFDCAKRRAAEALVKFFDSGCNDASTALAIARDRQQNRCLRCSCG